MKDNSITQEELERIYQEAAAGDDSAFKFILAWGNYVHTIDDIVDGDMSPSNRNINRLMFSAAQLYSSDFYRLYSYCLYPLIALITADYSDSNEEGIPNAQFLASTGNNMIKMIAFIKGGYPLLEVISTKLNVLSAKAHPKE